MKQILFVEDDEMIASGLIYALEQEDYEVIHCKSVNEALSVLQNNKFDLAILDMQLRDGSGFGPMSILWTQKVEFFLSA